MSEADDDFIKRHDELKINKICSFILRKKKACEVPQQNQYSHYKCDENGDLKCLPGTLNFNWHLVIKLKLEAVTVRRLARRSVRCAVVQAKLRSAPRLLQTSQRVSLQARFLRWELRALHSTAWLPERRMSESFWVPLSQGIWWHLLSRTWELNLEIFSFLFSAFARCKSNFVA